MGVYWRTQYLRGRCSEFCYFALKRHLVLAKGFIIIFRFFHRGKPAVHWSVTTADPHRVLLFHAFASLALGSGSDAVFAHLVHPDGMPVGHSVGSTRPTILCHSIPLSQHNGAGATNRLGNPAGLHWRQSVHLLRTVHVPSLGPTTTTTAGQAYRPCCPLANPGPLIMSPVGYPL